MDKLRKTLGWLYFSIGLMLLLFVVLSWKDTPSSNMAAAQTAFISVLIGGLIYSAAGLSLLRNFKYSAWICLPLAVLSLFYFPFGTITGACYLWYYWKFVYQRSN